MSATSQLVTLLMADSAVTALIASGSPLDYRIDPDFAQGEDNPRVVYQLIDASNVNAHGGKTATESRMQISCWADTRSGAHALADAVESAIEDSGHVISRRDDRDQETRDFRTMVFWSYWS